MIITLSKKHSDKVLLELSRQITARQFELDRSQKLRLAFMQSKPLFYNGSPVKNTFDLTAEDYEALKPILAKATDGGAK